MLSSWPWIASLTLAMTVRRRAPAPLLRLVDIPEHRRRRAVENAGQRFAPGGGREILAERDVDHLLERFLLDVGGDLLLVVGRGGAHKGVLQLFDLLVF